MPFLPPLRLTGATILRDGRMQSDALAIIRGQIQSDAPADVDLSGYLILPGIIDLHGDGFEHHMAPRVSAPMPMQLGLASTDREAAAHGVTTAFLAQGWSWEGGHRSPDHALTMMQALADYRPHALTDLRLQIRAETHLVDHSDRLLAAVARYRVPYVVFNNHLDEGLMMHQKAPADFALWARKLGKTADEMLYALKHASANAPHVPAKLSALAEAFDTMGVCYGSHDDPDGETRARYATIGARIAEFPISLRAAEAAQTMMSPVIMGAPNVVRGKSQAGNVAATDLIAAGLCDALVSDYHMPALALAAWKLVDRGLASLPKAWAMISTKPAEILRLSDRGRLDEGLRADLVVINSETRVVEATICGGRLTYLAGEAAVRFLQPSKVARMAAE